MWNEDVKMFPNYISRTCRYWFESKLWSPIFAFHIYVYLDLNRDRKLFYHFCEFLNACLKDKECKHSNFSKWHFLLRHSLRSIECISRRWQKKTQWFDWSRRAIDFDIDSDQLDLFGSSQQWLWQVPTSNLGITL